ncbi:hypothetical protein AB0M22_44990 [Nocardia sp. NPDC051756]|uniref:hypothetical protein n=1 Tax=Nocardia sp. NPDC051756 TaxID=3154751 RepID=UPI003416D6FB
MIEFFTGAGGLLSGGAAGLLVWLLLRDPMRTCAALVAMVVAVTTKNAEKRTAALEVIRAVLAAPPHRHSLLPHTRPAEPPTSAATDAPAEPAAEPPTE